ncbi:hypothetical protein AVDCRST_MAG92-1134 [uncultured Coleofasciculus sp.]|uniref:Uncharacterized protein n=1 Tax=uncultured Coleofasciculus sp. TaxID=1267456 RepID=A0A6J4HUE5_9CYAN|nr:hypothetical protein AVDCRST_MAG92-1134 [uncultured Coleofasciculus sp.]
MLDGAKAGDEQSGLGMRSAESSSCFEREFRTPQKAIPTE